MKSKFKVGDIIKRTPKFPRDTDIRYLLIVKVLNDDPSTGNIGYDCYDIKTQQMVGYALKSASFIFEKIS